MSTTELSKTQNAIDYYLNSSALPIITFRQGVFTQGKDEVPLGTRFVAKPRDHRIGVQKWQDGKPSESRMGFLHDGFVPPARDELGDHDETLWDPDSSGNRRDPWQRSETIPLVADDGEEFEFVTGSWGGHTALVKLQRAFRSDGSRRNPVMELASEKHKNNFGGFNDRPVLRVIGWTDLALMQPNQPLIEAPKTAFTSGKPAAEIIDDGIPF